MNAFIASDERVYRQRRSRLSLETNAFVEWRQTRLAIEMNAFSAGDERV